ncbi:hypothetical protein PVAP13_5NG630700 [Panicum virgatum]|uniref:Alanine racemase N-terminal domain-containing protein n=1 Tax=Panicum virgatum TaxID=38727 RepID=A0A8T0S9J9_PANVG|nr:hypothetical protein PVAP13_5NG630700 [Panicum virgatum]
MEKSESATRASPRLIAADASNPSEGTRWRKEREVVWGWQRLWRRGRRRRPRWLCGPCWRGQGEQRSGRGAQGKQRGLWRWGRPSPSRCCGSSTTPDIAENYVQEIVTKAPQLPEDIRWHFIGHLQSNKVKPLLAAVPNLDMVEGADNEKVANHLDRAVNSLGREPLKVLVQVNTSGEESKSGIDPSRCVELAKHVKLACPHLIFSVLMTIGTGRL